MKHYSPSSLATLSLCPRWTPDDEVSNEAAEAGTLFHSDLENIIMDHPPSEFEAAVAALNRSDDHKDMVREALRQAEAYLCLGLTKFRNSEIHGTRSIEPGVYLETAIDLWPGERKPKVGRIDLLFVPEKGRLVIVDWKSNRADADFTWQLGAYAAALRRVSEDPVKSITARVIAPRLEDHGELVFDNDALDVVDAKIKALEERVNNPFSQAVCGPQQCKYCRCARLRQCPAFTLTATTDPSGWKTLGEYPRPRVPLYPETLEDRALRRDWATIASMLVDFVKEDDKAFFAANQGAQLPGYKVSTRDGNRRLDPTKCSDCIKALAAKTLTPIEDFVDVCEPKKDRFVEKYAIITGSKAYAEKVWDETVEGFTTRGAPVTTIRRDATRRLAKPEARTYITQGE